MTRLFLLAALLLSFHGSATAESIRLATPRGASLEVIVDLPIGEGRIPALVLAPGQGYHMTLPALQEIAQRLVAQGIAVYRFNWAYYTRNPKVLDPSADLSEELQDLQTVIRQARSNPRIAPSQLFVGGKSLGSRVAWRALSQDSSLRGGLFLTPACIDLHAKEPTENAEGNYPGIADERRPVAFVAGDQDPLCSPAALYRFAAKAAGAARVAIVGGNHGFQIPALSGLAQTAAHRRSIGAVADFSANFILDSVAE